jgi:hypothetical protein
MQRMFLKRGLIILLVFLFSIFLAIYVASRPRLAPGQEPLVDIRSIETLRTQFNQDVGKTRLILLVSPT